MRISRVLGVIGRLLRVFCLGFLPPLALCLWDGYQGVAGQYQAAGQFALALAITWLAGTVFAHGFIPRPDVRLSSNIHY